MCCNFFAKYYIVFLYCGCKTAVFIFCNINLSEALTNDTYALHMLWRDLLSML